MISKACRDGSISFPHGMEFGYNYFAHFTLNLNSNMDPDGMNKY